MCPLFVLYGETPLGIANMGFYGSFIADTPKPLYNRIKRLKCAENEQFRAFIRMRMRAYVPRVIFMVFP